MYEQGKIEGTPINGRYLL